MLQKDNAYWLAKLEPADVWCALVLDYDALMKEESYKILEMGVVVTSSNGVQIKTTRCPVEVNGEIMKNKTGAPFIVKN